MQFWIKTVDQRWRHGKQKLLKFESFKFFLLNKSRREYKHWIDKG